MPASPSDALRLARMVALFVPASRPDRFGKALASGADRVILDLEDAIGVAEKASARKALAAACPPGVIVRINASGTPWHDEDVAVVRSLPAAAVMLPKSEDPDTVAAVAAALGGAVPLVALIESAVGLAAARAIARVPQVVRLAFGSIDFSADLGCTESREALLSARSEVVLAARLAGQGGPIDGVTTRIDHDDAIKADAAHAAGLGFAGKLCIHPRQVAPACAGLAPPEEDVAWARGILAALAAGGSVVKVDGAMVDTPVRLRAERILARAGIAEAV